jgi:hypothetical protein
METTFTDSSSIPSLLVSARKQEERRYKTAILMAENWLNYLKRGATSFELQEETITETLIAILVNHGFQAVLFSKSQENRHGCDFKIEFQNFETIYFQAKKMKPRVDDVFGSQTKHSKNQIQYEKLLQLGQKEQVYYLLYQFTPNGLIQFTVMDITEINQGGKGYTPNLEVDDLDLESFELSELLEHELTFLEPDSN